MMSNASYRIAFLSGEFADPAMETRYRAYAAPETSRQARRALTVWGILLILFIPADFVTYGNGRALYASLGMRFATILMLIGSWLWFRRHPLAAVEGRLMTGLTLLAFTLFLWAYRATPPENIPWLVAVISIMLFGMFVMLPNRPLLAGLVGLYVIAAMVLLAAHAVPTTTPYRLTILSLILLLPVSCGFIAAYRFQAVRRAEFAALEQARAEITRSAELEAELRQQAAIDPLTGASTRRHYETVFQTELARARRQGRPLALCLFDLDHFKRINDTYGHAAGDAALQATADICRSELRATDLLGRLGGEEFVILLPDTNRSQAMVVAERLRLRLAEASVTVSGQRLTLTATFGVTELLPTDTTLADLLRRADQALLDGKRTGRNRVCSIG